MQIELGKILLGVNPHREALDEAMYRLTLDGWPASKAEIAEVWEREKESARFWGRSGRLFEVAAFVATDPRITGGADKAKEILEEGYEWAAAEQNVIRAEVSPRIGGGPNNEFDNTPAWKEADRLKELEKLGVPIGALDYPIVAVGFLPQGWRVTLGDGMRADMMGSENNSPVVYQAGKQLNGKDIVVERMCGPEGFDRKFLRDFRTFWRWDFEPKDAWKGKEFFALGIIRTW